MGKSTCSFEGCEKPLNCRGLCGAHVRQLRSGKPLRPLGGTSLTLEQRILQKIDKTETCWNWTSSISHLGYGEFWANGSRRKAHRFVYEHLVGPIPEGFFVDHMCHNRACVNPEHLRLVTNKQNAEHAQGAQRGTRSGVLGVSWHWPSKKWVARVRHNGHLHFLGYYLTPEEAGEVARLKRVELFTHNDRDRINK